MCNFDHKTHTLGIALKERYPKIRQIENATLSAMELVSGQLVSVDTEVSVTFKMGNHSFHEKFLSVESEFFDPG